MNHQLEEIVASRTKELLELSNHYKAILQNAGLAIISTSPDGIIQVVNKSAEEMFGYKAEELIGHFTPMKLIHSGDLDQHMNQFFSSGEKPESMNFRDLITIAEPFFYQTKEWISVRKNGDLFPTKVTISTIQNDAGEIVGFTGIIIDITESNQLYQDLALERRRLSEIIRGTNIATWEWNIQTGETVFNEKWADIIGYTLEEISPVSIQTWMQFAHPEDLLKSGEFLEKHFNGELDYYSFESRMKHKNGKWVWVLDRGMVHEWTPDGKPLLMSGTHQDITERKKSEEELRQAKEEAEIANRAKSEFLSRMSHELRTPLNSILGFAQLLDLAEQNPSHRKGIRQILNNGSHLLSLINEVLDISGIESGRQKLFLEVVPVYQCIQEVVDAITITANNLDVSIFIDRSHQDEVHVIADSRRLKQILLNLSSNGLKYNRKNGSLTFLVTPTINAENKPMIRISIQDTGMGIHADDFSKLFQPFERLGANKTEVEGTGLGLMVVKKFTESMGGTVIVDSTVGVGSTFSIELPRNPISNIQRINEEDPTQSNENQFDTKGTILYIEDNLANLELIQNILTSQRPGIQLITSYYGKHAVELVKQHQPNLLLLDLDLPDINGIEILDILKSNPTTKNLPVIIVSADAMPDQIEHAMQSGAYKYITKPLDIRVFLNIIDEVLDLN